MPRRPLILCVDDEFNGLEGRKMLLEEAGFHPKAPIMLHFGKVLVRPI